MASASRVFILFQCLVCVGISVACWQLYERGVARLHADAEQGAEEILDFIDDHLQLCRDGIIRMRPDIISHGGNTDHAITLMNRAVDGAYNWGLRFGWSNAQKQLIAGSVIGRIDPPYDLTGRYYAEAAIEKPGVPHFDVVSHVIFERPILIIAIGITNPEGNYLGTLAALLDITTMNETLKRIALEHLMEVRIQSQKGAFIFSNIEQYKPGIQQETQLTSAHDYVTIYARPPASQIKALAEHYLIVAFVFVAGFILISRYLYRLYVTRWAAPLKRLAHILSEATGEAVVLRPESGYNINEVVQKASNIRDIIDASHNMRDQSEEQARQLREALSLIQSFQHEQATFFQSFSVEVEQVADTLEEYLANVGEVTSAHADIARKYNLASQLPQLDAPYPIEDANEHMRYLSLCFLLMCEDITSQEKRDVHYQNDAQRYNLRNVYADAIEAMHAQHEERLITLDGDLSFETQVDPQIFNVMVLASIYMANRHMTHDTTMNITLNQEEKSVTVSGTSEQQAPRYAAQEYFDMQVADPSSTGRLVKHLGTDIHAYIMRYFLRNMGGELALSHEEGVMHITIKF